ncbi:hypothetical protein Tco_1271319 [Tanacetum coccineum]
MTRLVENSNKNKFCEFHRDKGHNTDECIHLRKKIEEAVKSRKLSHLIKEIKQGSNRGEHAKTAKKVEASNKEKATAIFMEISFPPLANNDGQENPIVIEVEVEGHLIHRMYVDGGSTSEVLYEHCFNRLRLEVKSRMIQATTPLLGFSGEISWSLGHISLMVSLGDEEHSVNALMNFIVVSKPLHRITVHWPPGVLKNPSVPIHGTPTAQIPGRRGNSDIRRNTITPARMHNGSEDPQVLSNKKTTAEGIKVAIHPEYPKQTVTIGESLSKKGKMELYDLLRSNLDIFT